MASENNSTRRTVMRNGEFPCQDCGKILTRRDALVRHRRTAHGSGSEFWCDQAGCSERNKGYRRFHDYAKHMRTKHNVTVAMNSVPSRQTVRRERRIAIANGHDEVDDQAAPQVIQQPVAQPDMHANFPYAPVAAPQIPPQFMGPVAPEPLAQTPPNINRIPVPDTPRPAYAYPYVPDLYREPMFRKSDLQEPPRGFAFPSYVPVYVPDDQGGEIMFRKSEGFQPGRAVINQPFINYNQQHFAHHNLQPIAHHNQQPVVHHNQQPFVHHNQPVAHNDQQLYVNPMVLVNHQAQNAASNYIADDEQERRRSTRVLQTQTTLIEDVHIDYARMEEARRELVREDAKRSQATKGNGNPLQ
ncbi:hypothetical protein F4680DRAFT_463769 [Xylaria scruposa]|nr:hypothetical protein F4680DRAFT_463769 [Xylaria scruposa]